MAKIKQNITLGVLIALISVTTAYSSVDIPLLEGTIYSSQTNQPVRSGHVEILDFNMNPPQVLYLGAISTYGTYSLTNWTG